MRVPIRKGDKYVHLKPDPYITEDKFNELKNKLEHLKNVTRLRLMKEVATLAEMGDLSENAAYQIAKGKLRGVNQAMIDIEDHLKKAILIKPGKFSEVRLGTKVTIEINGKEKSYLILGSSEVDPLQHIISHNSPIGAALMNKRVGDVFKIRIGGKETVCKILKIV
jgi:transcription elongation factor GreA